MLGASSVTHRPNTGWSAESFFRKARIAGSVHQLQQGGSIVDGAHDLLHLSAGLLQAGHAQHEGDVVVLIAAIEGEAVTEGDVGLEEIIAMITRDEHDGVVLQR